MSSTDHNAELVRDYLKWCKDVRGLAQSSLYAYSSVLSLLLDHLRGTDLVRASLPQLEGFITRPRGGRAHGQRGSAATQTRDVAVISNMYSYLHGRGLIASNPALLLSGPKVQNKNPRPVPDDVWRRLWDAELRPLERVLMGLGYFCGLRRVEMVSIAPHQVTEAAFVSFKRKGGGDDIFPLGDVMDVWRTRMPHLGSPDPFLAELFALKERRAGKDYLLPRLTLFDSRRIHERATGLAAPDDVNRLMLRMFKRLEMDAEFTPHQLRHAFISNLLRAGVPLHLVSKLANHSDTGTTMRYCKAGGQELKEWSRGYMTNEITRF